MHTLQLEDVVFLPGSRFFRDSRWTQRLNTGYAQYRVQLSVTLVLSLIFLELPSNSGHIPRILPPANESLNLIFVHMQ